MKVWMLDITIKGTNIGRLKAKFDTWANGLTSQNMHAARYSNGFAKNIARYVSRSLGSGELPLEMAELCIENHFQSQAEALAAASDNKIRRRSLIQEKTGEAENSDGWTFGINSASPYFCHAPRKWRGV